MTRFVRPALGLVALLASALPAQNTVRWNDVMASLEDETKDPPAVRVWLDQRIYSAGAPVRVGYRTEEDAFVVVARVDFDGNLNVLYPAGKNRVTTVAGNTDNFVRSARFGSSATFLAAERVGSTGYVFAIASRFPLDVSRLSQRDFSAWVTGMPVGQPKTRYIGDPYRVIQRFARLVLYTAETEWDYDMEFYSVDQPHYVTTAGNYYSNNCLRYQGGYAMRSGISYYGGGFFDDGYGYAPVGCGGYQYMSCFNSYWAFGMILPSFCGNFNNGGQVVTGPKPPPVRPDSGDTVNVNPWVPDSVSRPNVDKAPGGNVNGPHIMAVDPTRPSPSSVWRAEDDLSFSIPARALRANRAKDGGSDLRRSPGANSGNGPLPMPARREIEVANGPNQPIEWVRPPRALEPTRGHDNDRMPSRNDIRRDRSERNDSPRGSDRMADWNPPPRASSPIFDRELPTRNPGFSAPPRDFSTGHGGGFNPPGRFDHGGGAGAGIRPMTNPGLSSPPPSQPPPQPAASTSTSTAKDPPEKKP